MSLRTWLIKLLGGIPANNRNFPPTEREIEAVRVPAILNTVTIGLSDDARSIYLIDKNSEISYYDLTKAEGVNIGLKKGQLSAFEELSPTSGTITPFDSIKAGNDSSIKKVSGASKDSKLQLAIGDNSQYNLAYNAGTRSLSLAGASNLSHDAMNTLSGSCELHLLSLKGQKISFKFSNGFLLVKAI